MMDEKDRLFFTQQADALEDLIADIRALEANNSDDTQQEIADRMLGTLYGVDLSDFESHLKRMAAGEYDHSQR